MRQFLWNSIQTRLIVGIGLLVFLFAALGAGAFFSLRDLIVSSKEIEVETATEIAPAVEIDHLMEEAKTFVYEYALTGDPRKSQEFIGTAARINKTLKDLRSVKEVQREEREHILQSSEKWRLAQTEALAVLSAPSETDAGSIEKKIKRFVRLTLNGQKSVAEIREHAEKELREQRQTADAARRRALGLIGLFVGTGFGCAMLVSRSLSKSILEPVRQLSDATNRFSSGDLTYRTDVLGADELGSLGTAFNTMADGLEEQRRDLRTRYRTEEVLNRLLQVSLKELPLVEQLRKALSVIISTPFVSLKPRGAIFLADDSARELVLTAHWNFAPELLTICERVPFGRCLCGRAAAERTLLFDAAVGDLHDNRFPGMKPHGHFVAPIISRDGLGPLLGVVVVYVEPGHVEKDGEADFVGTVANALACMIERARTSEALTRSQTQIQDVLDKTPTIVYVKDLRGRYALVNHKYEEFFRISRDNVLGKTDRELYPPPIAVSMSRTDKEALEKKRAIEVDEKIPHEDGPHEYLTVKFPLVDANGAPYAVCGIATDITERKKTEAQIKHMAFHDLVTNLPNRRLLKESLDVALAHAKRTNRLVALIFLDLDHFKNINDTFGHEAGDLLLRETADRLRRCLRKTDIPARSGGDEFNALLTNIKSPGDAALVAAKILSALAAPFEAGAHKIVTSASAGLAIFPDDGTTADTLMKHADLALYRAKATGRGRYQFFTEEMQNRDTERSNIEKGLRAAIEVEQLTLFFQPCVDLKTGRLAGAEALIRWKHPDQGLISPDRFIDVAEDSGLIVPIGRLVFEQVSRQMASWLESGYELCPFMVNVSGRQIENTGLVESFSAELKKNNIDPHLINLEITESVLLDDTESAVKTLAALKQLGMGIILDDFGTGYSSLTYLRKFPFDMLKIDRSFIQDMGENTTIVKAMISLAHDLGLEVIAEGVETRDELAMLREYKADAAQGFLFSKPVPAADFEVFLKKAA